MSRAKTIRSTWIRFGLVERDFSDLGAVAEIATDCDAASPILSNRRRCLLGCNFERPQRTGIAGKQFAPQVDRIATSGKSELVDRGLARELGMGVAN